MIELEMKWDEINTKLSTNAKDNSANIRWLAFTDDNESEDDVRNYAAANLPDTYDTLRIRDFETKRHENSDDVWALDVSYEHVASAQVLPALEVDDVRWGIRTSGQTSRKRLYSLGLKSETVDTTTGDSYKFNTGPRAKWKNVVGLKIGEDGSLSVEGVDYSFSEILISAETVKSAAQISGGYLINAADLASRNVVNSTLWRGFAIGTVRLIDYSAVERAGDAADWDINFTLVFSPNLTNIAINSEITVPAKAGHDLLDVLYLPEKLPDGPFSVYRAVRAAVHQWYELVNLTSQLGV